MTVLERVCAACGVVAAAPGGAGGVFAQQDEAGALRRERGQLRQQQQRLREAQLLSETSGGRKLAQAKALTRYLERVAAHRGDIQARLELAVDPHALFVSPPERHAGLCALLSSELDAHVAASAAWARATEWARAGGEVLLPPPAPAPVHEAARLIGGSSSAIRTSAQTCCTRCPRNNT